MYTLDDINPQLAIAVRDKNLGLIGYLVIDQLVEGASCGGIRMAENISIEEIARLANEMTMKFSFVNLEYGGAKAGVIAPKNMSRSQREDIFFAFGRSIGPFIRNGIYNTGEDLGTFPEDLFHVFRGSGTPIDRYSLEAGSSGYYTALTVFLTTKVLAERKGLNLPDCTVAIEGFGKVGKSLAKIISAASMKLIAVSSIKGGLYNPSGLHIDQLLSLHEQYGDDFVHQYHDAEHLVKEDLFSLDVDILVPCAGADAINSDNVEKIKAKLIVPGANIPFSSDAEKIMVEKNIWFVPGYVSNCGSILKGFLNSTDFSKQEIERVLTKCFVQKIDRLCERSHKEKISLLDAARSVCHENLAKRQELKYLGKKKRIFLLLRKWRKGGLGELITILLWRVYKKSLKYRLQFCTKPFAEQYIKYKHFEA